MISSYELSTDGNSVKYSNLFLKDKTLYYLTNEDVILPEVNSWAYSCLWIPVVKKFDTEEEINKFVGTPHVIKLALFGDILWHHNVGHALWDGLYPLYTGLIKFNLQNEDFIFLTREFDNELSLAHEIVTTFSGTKPVDYMTANPTLIKTLVTGTGNVGNVVMNESYTLGGTEYDGVQIFKQRMYKKFLVDVPLSTTEKMNIVIIYNKRYSVNETVVLHKIVDYFSRKEDINIEYLDWSSLKSFKNQLEKIKNIDIQVTGPGTAMMYTPFLKKGSVNINLGYMEHSQTNTARPNIKITDCRVEDFIFPGWMEQSVCNATSYVSTFYYDRYTNNEIEFQSLKTQIYEALSFIKEKKIKSTNLNLDAQIFVEYCRRCKNPKEVCTYLTNKAFFIELFVCEHPYAVPSNIVDIELLRQIKKEMNYNFKYDYPKNVL